ncbi:MAG: hypothetical protein AAFX94_16825, partial [Myxococcota bacterium]
SVDIPDGALTTETEIVVSEAEATPQPVVDGFTVAGSVLTLEPHGIAFEEPVELTLTFERPVDVEPWRYSVMRLADENDTTWERVENAYPAADGTVRFTVQTFSVLAVVERQDGCLNTACADDEEYFSARYSDCLSSGNSSEYCSGWLGCAGPFDVGSGEATGTGSLCETPCDASVCVNGTCDAGGGCVCFGGFEGETCDTAVDLCPGDDDKTAPGACGCGVPDTDSDQDGTPDCSDGCVDDPTKNAAGVCGCGEADTDSDADGTADCLDACPNDMNKTAAGVCGCGVSDADGDEDETPDCLDSCPSDPMKTAPGECGCGQVDGTCEPVCPCFDADFVAKVAGGLERSCQVGFQGEQYIFSSASGAFVDAAETFVPATVETREYYDNQGFECLVECDQESMECTATSSFIDEATHDACQALIAADSNCQSQLP